MKYTVVSRFYDNGKTEAEIHLESENIPDENYFQEKENYDQYIDEFTSYEEAEEFKVGVSQA